MKEKEILDSGVYFTEPLYLPNETEPVLGFAFNYKELLNNKAEQSTDKLMDYINTYVRYLCLICKWYKDGGAFVDNAKDIWIDANGHAYTYSLYDKFFMDYTDKAWAEHPIRYNVIFETAEFKDDELDDFWIINRRM